MNLSNQEKAYLLYVARCALYNKFQADNDPNFVHPVFETDSDALTQKGAVFSSLYAHKVLRGSHGHYIAYNPVIVECYDQTFRAGFQSKAFAPIQFSEIETLEIVLSILTKPIITDANTVVIGQHGIMIKKGTIINALLLPHAAIKEGFTVEQFWSACCVSAGLPNDSWQSGRLSLLKFSAEEFSDANNIMRHEINTLLSGSD
jgi:uncharacterized protein (TIGR00296 family)